MKVEPNPKPGYCACGEKLHYTDKSLEERVKKIVEELGEFIVVENADTRKKYRVQRHFIALHGIKGKDLAELGFAKWEETSNK